MENKKIISGWIIVVFSLILFLIELQCEFNNRCNIFFYLGKTRYINHLLNGFGMPIVILVLGLYLGYLIAVIFGKKLIIDVSHKKLEVILMCIVPVVAFEIWYQFINIYNNDSILQMGFTFSGIIFAGLYIGWFMDKEIRF